MPNTRLTLEQEGAFFKKMENGGPDGDAARKEFISLNQPLIGSIARHDLRKGLPWEELLALGNIGLSKAADKFDYKKGFKFSTYAVWWIRGSIKQAVLRFAIAARRAKGQHTDAELSDYYGGLEDVVEPEEVADGLDDQCDAINSEIDSGEVQRGEAEHLTPASATTQGIGTHAGHALECASFSDDPLPCTAELEDETTGELGTDFYLEAVEEAIPRLVDARQRRILEMHFGLCGNKPCTLAELAQVFGISLQRVAVIEKAAIEQLRKDPSLSELTQ